MRSVKRIDRCSREFVSIIIVTNLSDKREFESVRVRVRVRVCVRVKV